MSFVTVSFALLRGLPVLFTWASIDGSAPQGQVAMGPLLPLGQHPTNLSQRWAPRSVLSPKTQQKDPQPPSLPEAEGLWGENGRATHFVSSIYLKTFESTSMQRCEHGSCTEPGWVVRAPLGTSPGIPAHRSPANVNQRGWCLGPAPLLGCDIDRGPWAWMYLQVPEPCYSSTNL